jgi:hypothetical protein
LAFFVSVLLWQQGNINSISIIAGSHDCALSGLHPEKQCIDFGRSDFDCQRLSRTVKQSPAASATMLPVKSTRAENTNKWRGFSCDGAAEDHQRLSPTGELAQSFHQGIRRDRPPVARIIAGTNYFTFAHISRMKGE